MVKFAFCFPTLILASTSATSVLEKLFDGVVSTKMMEDTREILAPEVNMIKAKNTQTKIQGSPRRTRHAPSLRQTWNCKFFDFCFLIDADVPKGEAVSFFFCCSIFHPTLCKARLKILGVWVANLWPFLSFS